jgi:hypothetical protein
MEKQNLTKEELTKLQELNNLFTQTKLKLADTVMQQSIFLKDLDKVKSQFNVMEKELSEIYGNNSIIDLATGEVKQQEEKKEEKK